MIKRIARFKIYVDRARWYLVLIQFIFIVLTYVKVIGVELNWWHYPMIIIVLMFLLIFLGYLDRFFGIIKEEQRFYSSENPVIQEILNKLKENEKKN